MEYPESPLLYIPSDPSRTLNRDLKAAGIPKVTSQGKVDFHATPTAFINFLIDQDFLTPKEVQELARHSSINLTMNAYGRTHSERLAEGVERTADWVLNSDDDAVFMPRQAVGAERESATLLNPESCAFKGMAPRVGFEPTTKWLTATS